MITTNWKHQLLSTQPKKVIKKKYDVFILALTTSTTHYISGVLISLLIIFLPNKVLANNEQSTTLSNTLVTSEKNKTQAKLKQNPWLFLQPYKAIYQVSSDGDKLGSASRRLWYKNGLWQLEMSSRLKKWFLTLKSREYTQFQLKESLLLTNYFLSSTKVSFKKERKVEQQFNWKTRQETGSKGKRQWRLPIKDNTYDRMSHILKLRADLLNNKTQFNYLISYKGKTKNYQYKKLKQEKLKTPMGEINAVRLNRVDGNDKSFSIWLSPEFNYLPVKIAQFERDKPDVILTLSQLE